MLLSFHASSWAMGEKALPYAEVTSGECAAQEGRVLNTLDGESCAEDEYVYANVLGMKCPCVCCKKIEEEKTEQDTTEQTEGNQP